MRGIEIASFKKADSLNDKLLDELNDEWEEFIEFMEREKISKICEFRGEECIDFDDELLSAIVTTLKKSLNDTNKSIGYNSKKIALNRVIDGEYQ